MTCIKYGQNKNEAEFYTKKDKSKFYICKNCIVTNIDIDNPNKTPLYFQIFDIPILGIEWNKQAKIYEYPIWIFSKYLALMKCAEYRIFGFNDGKILNAQRNIYEL